MLLTILAIPIGFVISWYARDELIQGRRWFIGILIVSVIGIIISFINREYVLVYSFDFVSIVSLISYAKSFDKRWTKR